MNDPALPTALTSHEGRLLLDVARTSIRVGVFGEGPLVPDPERFPARLREPGAAFVTLELGGDLRGCIGSLEPRRSLVEDVAANAHGAAFRDPRFPPVNLEEEPFLSIHLSILGPQVRLPVRSEQELLQELVPGLDGLVVDAGGFRRATFLPQVWEQLPEPVAFLAHLKKKAGLTPDYWAEDLRFYRYRMEEIR